MVSQSNVITALCNTLFGNLLRNTKHLVCKIRHCLFLKLNDRYVRHVCVRVCVWSFTIACLYIHFKPSCVAE